MPPVGPPTSAIRAPQQIGPQQASRPGMTPVGPPTQQPLSRPGIPPAGRPGPPLGARPPVAGPPPDDVATAVHPAIPADDRGFPPTVQSRLAGMPPEAATTEEFPLVPPGPAGPPGPTQVVAPVGPQPQRRPPGPPMERIESTQAHPGPYVDDFEDSRPQERLFDDDPGDDFHPSRREDFDGPDDFDDRDRPDRDRIDAMDDDGDSLSPGREWLLMGAQVGVGAIAGALVFLGFSWLWGFQPIVAVLAALVVIVGLVFGVRRWRRADDLQTTVLAVLAGLVVTVSPAALLLVRR